MTNALKYQSDYSCLKFKNFLKTCWHKVGMPLVHKALLLFYALQNPRVPAREKMIIIASLGYLISPVDAVPDCLPGGFLDDAAVIGWALLTVYCYIDEKTEHKAKKTLEFLCGKS